MMRNHRFALAAAAGAAIPTTAQANAGIGFFMMALPFLAVAFFVAVPLEALVLAALLRLDARRALMVSLIANFISTLVGVVIGVAIDAVLIGASGSAGPDPTRSAAIAMLLPLFFLTWGIEHRSVAKRVPEQPLSRVSLATGVANVLSYFGVAIFIFAVMPQTGSSTVWMQASAALRQATILKTSIAEFHARNNRFPRDFAELGMKIEEAPRYQIMLEPGGRISIELRGFDDPKFDGKRFVLAPAIPTQPGSFDLSWTCRSVDVPSRALPMDCRR